MSIRDSFWNKNSIKKQERSIYSLRLDWPFFLCGKAGETIKSAVIELPCSVDVARLTSSLGSLRL